MWTLQNTLPGAPITATFQQGTVSGSGGCNTYTGPYSTSGGAISVGPLAITGVVCDPAVTEQETLYLARLQVANEYQIEGNQLRISGQIGSENFILIYTGVRP